MILRARIATLAGRLGRPVTVVDVGGRRDYWENIGTENIARIELFNIDAADLNRASSNSSIFTDRIGDARNLAEVGDGAFDLYHSNSVIEHVGGWADMQAMAREARRIAPSGWLQTPAWEFPIEPHFRLPFMHWLSAPSRAALLRLARHYRSQDRATRRMHVERINLVTRGELKILFPGCDILTERFALLPKSYIAVW
jgi:hypothetical protein